MNGPPPSRRPERNLARKNLWVAFAFAAFGLSFFFGSYWIVYYKSKNNHIDPSKPLPPSTQFRGAYTRAGIFIIYFFFFCSNESGMKDVGPDPDNPGRYGWAPDKKFPAKNEKAE